MTTATAIRTVGFDAADRPALMALLAEEFWQGSESVTLAGTFPQAAHDPFDAFIIVGEFGDKRVISEGMGGGDEPTVWEEDHAEAIETRHLLINGETVEIRLMLNGVGLFYWEGQELSADTYDAAMEKAYAAWPNQEQWVG